MYSYAVAEASSTSQIDQPPATALIGLARHYSRTIVVRRAACRRSNGTSAILYATPGTRSTSAGLTPGWRCTTCFGLRFPFVRKELSQTDFTASSLHGNRLWLESSSEMGERVDELSFTPGKLSSWNSSISFSDDIQIQSPSFLTPYTSKLMDGSSDQHFKLILYKYKCDFLHSNTVCVEMIVRLYEIIFALTFLSAFKLFLFFHTEFRMLCVTAASSVRDFLLYNLRTVRRSIFPEKFFKSLIDQTSVAFLRNYQSYLFNTKLLGFLQNQELMTRIRISSLVTTSGKYVWLQTVQFFITSVKTVETQWFPFSPVPPVPIA
uniref:Uncharacterized protein n=1 Tax=Glossina pallidipes TaxID=7398 RepID=A0A1A9ZJC5_GLOPL